MIQVKRIYEPASDQDGYRILVDRLWPRGISKDKAAVDHWLRAIAPSDDLRKWFGHDPAKWDAFKQRYFDELKDMPELIEWLKNKIDEQDRITLLFAAKDTQHNNAIALKKYLS